MGFTNAKNFTDMLDDAQEIEVEDGDWVGTFSRSPELSEGYPIFSKLKGIKETWKLRKLHGVWTFFNFKSGSWLIKERLDPQTNLWLKANNLPKLICVRVTKRLSNDEKICDESWGDNLLKKMWEQGIGYDLKIRLKSGQEIDAHKSVIAAACPAWKGLLDSNMVEAQSGVIIIPDINPDVVKAFVKALYCGEIEDQSLLPGIALMADRYNTEQLLHKVVHAMPEALETLGPDFYFEMVETLKRLPDTKDKRKMKAMLFAMNKDITEDIFYKRLGIK